MSLLGLLTMFIVVVAVALVRPVSLQTTLYSLPIPLTVGLASIPGAVSPLQPLSVFGAIAFFYLAALLRDLTGRVYVASLAAGLVVFVGIVGLNHVPLSNPWIATAIAVCAWIPIAVAALHSLRPRHEVLPSRQVDWKNVVTATPMFAVAALAAPLAGSLGAMFPFAGLAVSTAVSGRLWMFAHNFALRALALIGFSSVYAVTRTQYELHVLPALVFSWIAYLMLVALVLWATRRPQERTATLES